MTVRRAARPGRRAAISFDEDGTIPSLMDDLK